jgi:hypothetical protein
MQKCTLSFSARTILGLTFVSLSALGLNAQEFASNSAPGEPSSAAMSAPASVTTPSKPAWHDTELPADKLISADIRDGVLVVDGLVAKVQLNYDIHHVGYLYFYVPGIGTAVVTRAQMSGAVKVKDAFHGSNLAFTVGGHSFELTSESDAVGNGKREKAGKAESGKGDKEDAYVWLDTSTAVLDPNPMMGFGNTTQRPYVWPLSGPQAKDTTAHFVQPPPMPASVLPRTTLTVSYTKDTGVSNR